MLSTAEFVRAVLRVAAVACYKGKLLLGALVKSAVSGGQLTSTCKGTSATRDLILRFGPSLGAPTPNYGHRRMMALR